MTQQGKPQESPVGDIRLTGEGTIQLSQAAPELEAPLREIKLTGVGEIVARPNQVTLTIGHACVDADPAKSQAKNDKVMSAVISSLKDLGITDEDISTVRYNLVPHYKNVRIKKGKTERVTTRLDGYETTHIITATAHDVSLAGRLLAVGAAERASWNGGIEFTVDDKERDRLKLEAIRAAMQQAKDKAETALTFCGCSVVAMEPINVDEQQRGGFPEPGWNGRVELLRAPEPGPAELSVPVEPGSISIKATVTMLFRF